MAAQNTDKHRIVVIGGGPGGYESAIAGAQLGADVTLIERTGVGGSAVLTDVVPSKALIASAEAAVSIQDADELGIQFFVRDDRETPRRPEVAVNLGKLNQRLLRLAQNQSDDIRRQLKDSGVRIIEGHGRISADGEVSVTAGTAGEEFDRVEYDSLVISVGASPRELDTAKPDGERILTWKQLYDLETLPEHLIVVGSGVTGAEFASAYNALGAEVTLISSRDRVLPGEDTDAADVIEEVFTRNGMNVLSKTRAESVVRDGDGVVATLSDGTEVRGTHCLMAVGSIPNTADIGLEKIGVKTTDSGHIMVNRVARTSLPNVYAAGDCSDFLPLASVASTQGRTAVFHALGDMVQPISRRNVASNVFTYPEIATVGWQEKDVREQIRSGRVHKLDLAGNPRAKMQGFRDGFVKLIAGNNLGTIIGGVIVAPRASELVLALSIAIEQRLTVDEIAESWAVYPSLSGSIVDAARAMHRRIE
ncbi:NAD(P)H-quinone dehydrogenase [Gulosibacter molinativorax]|uniref:NAD(P)H-quinone dehydrogenase n=1 Tax=Gulosibacter molinativorax TaxID=256821 RepID=A0ABT7C8D1_9MICO|nr:NAD(P)H-quinone dehydrogenase [Gulosibacter molinativorax]MDJ1371340.1 NAD(P)H-quinone dehydrogenase [Gulosibacter molinativorax]QUY63596.1 Dihydrolipoamide dehydrogenase [Gulosibacter molinativorax]